MASDDGYEIMPYKEVVELKKQICDLQKRMGDTSSKELMVSMSSLTKSMNDMLKLFSTAAEEMKLEQREEHALTERMGPLLDKINNLEEQNKTIAEGLVAVADMVKDKKAKASEIPHPRSKKHLDVNTTLPPLGPPGMHPGPDKGMGGLPPLDLPGHKPDPHKSPRVVPGPPGAGPMPPPGAPPRPMGGPPPLPGLGAPPGAGPMPPPGALPGPGGAPPGPPGLGPLPPLPPLEGGPKEKKKKGLFGMFKKK